jgi:hypothetical protein
MAHQRDRHRGDQRLDDDEVEDRPATVSKLLRRVRDDVGREDVERYLLTGAQ